MDDICKKFGRRLREIRDRKGMTQEKLSEISGLERSYISDVERGARSISLKNIERLASALGIQVNELFVFEDVKQDGNG
ncbi:MAG: helix-turn-helix transcriptional regulator [Thermotogaceae bacterium]|nr:helix-turn-helix transcriptional regulator [Thermotogaceae bacterium]